MKLIVIYGAPATGKYTVGTELSRRTGIPLLHNHLSIDLVRPFVEFGTDEFWKVNGEIRSAIIAAAARSGSDLIKTFVYGKGDDDPYFAKIIAAAEDNGGEIGLVLLVCDKEERRRRIGNESRVRLRKLTNPDSVDSSRFIMDQPIEGRESFVIDTTALPPEETARQIMVHFDIAEIGQELKV
ncbi:MAG: shikimate kinase [Pyrinomonadaceae bacterium]